MGSAVLTYAWAASIVAKNIWLEPFYRNPVILKELSEFASEPPRKSPCYFTHPVLFYSNGYQSGPKPAPQTGTVEGFRRIMQPTMLRSFIAVEIPGEVQQAISRSLAPLQKTLPPPLIRWVAPQNVHLTLKFLGDVSPSNLEKVAALLKMEACAHGSFSMTVQSLGAFPTSRRARVIWIGLEAPPLLLNLQRGIDAASAQLGYPSEYRPFSPHLTVGRVGQHATAADLQKIHTAVDSTHIGDLGNVHVEAVHIFKSDLRPGGSVYTHLYTLPMRT